MITLFSIPKPFQGESEPIQRRAIQSWLRLRPTPSIFLAGDDPGVAEAAREFQIGHLSGIERNRFGTPLVSDAFSRAHAVAGRGDVLCYVNADILLLSDFPEAVRLSSKLRRFLMVGQRWDLRPELVPAIGDPDWERVLRKRVAEHGRLHEKVGIDYFVFSQGVFGAIPPFAVGRGSWDNWLIYRARKRKAAVIDATPVVLAVHQDHGYGHVSGGKGTYWLGPEARENADLAGPWARFFSIADATHVLRTDGLRRALWENPPARQVKSYLKVRFPTLAGAAGPIFRRIPLFRSE